MVLGRSNPKMNTHEQFSRDERVPGGSDRSFGFAMAAVLGTLTLLNAWHSGRLWPWTGGLSVVFLSTGLLWPSVLNPLNRTWLKFGEILHNIVNPIVMALLFYATVLPTGLVMRALGKDLLRLKRQPGLETYWIVRAPAGPAPETMKDQF